jgi:hypothetical protein
MLKEKVPVGKINDLQDVFKDDSANQLIREEKIEGIDTKRVTSIAFKWE